MEDAYVVRWLQESQIFNWHQFELAACASCRIFCRMFKNAK